MPDEREECCGTCKYHKPDGTWPDDWVCVNPDSEHCADWTEYSDTCECYEPRKNRKG